VGRALVPWRVFPRVLCAGALVVAGCDLTPGCQASGGTKAPHVDVRFRPHGFCTLLGAPGNHAQQAPRARQRQQLPWTVPHQFGEWLLQSEDLTPPPPVGQLSHRSQVRLPLDSGGQWFAASVPDLLIFLPLDGISRQVVKLCHARIVQERNVCDRRRTDSLARLLENGCGEIWDNV
jgi:hypothetical protein